MSQQVAFRRIHGRIIPIRLTQDQRMSKAKLGTGEVIAGVGIGHLAGVKKGRWVEAAAQADNAVTRAKSAALALVKKTGPKISPDQMSFGFKQTIHPKGAVGVAANLAKAKRYGKYAKFSKIAGLAVAGALVTRGVTNLIEGAAGREANEPTKFALTVGGGLSTLGFQAGFLRRVGAAKNLKEAINAAIKSKQVRAAFKRKG